MAVEGPWLIHSLMKKIILFAIVVVSALLFSRSGFAAGTNDLATGLNAIISSVNTKLGAGKITEKDLADELKRFDDLYAMHKNEKTDDAAEILVMKAKLYLEVFRDPETAAGVIQHIKRDLPDTKMGRMADSILESLKEPIQAERIRRSLAEGTNFPDFTEKDLAGKPLSIANFKGKVVLVDFWATWCPPCRAELPNVIAAYQKYHDKGFEIIGVSLDDEQPVLENFLKENKMTWPEYFDGLHWKNKLAVKYGVMSVPADYLLDGRGRIIGKDLRGEALDAAVAKALAK